MLGTYPDQQCLGYADNSLTLMEDAMEDVEFTSQLRLDYSQYWTRGR